MQPSVLRYLMMHNYSWDCPAVDAVGRIGTAHPRVVEGLLELLGEETWGIPACGWDLALPTIKRKTNQELAQYLDGKGDAADSDTFLLAGSEDLVPEFKRDAGGAFLTNPDGNYQVREHDSPDASVWREGGITPSRRLGRILQ